MRGSLGGALQVAAQLGGTAGGQLAEAARAAWMDGVHLAFGVGAAIAFAAAFIAFAFLDRDRPADAEAADTAADPQEVGTDVPVVGVAG